jgi:hypothetical protein
MYDFVLLTSLTHPTKIILVVLQIGKYEIGKAKDLSAPIYNPTFNNILVQKITTQLRNYVYNILDDELIKSKQLQYLTT